jgi:hypothetical protein
MRATAAELNKIASHLSPVDRAIVEDAARRIGSVNRPHDLEARETAARLYEALWAADVAVNNATEEVSDEEFGAIQLRADKAHHDYYVQPLRVRFIGGVAERCAFSHVPILEDDDTLPVLASAIGAESEEQDEPLLPMFEMEPA